PGHARAAGELEPATARGADHAREPLRERAGAVFRQGRNERAREAHRAPDPEAAGHAQAVLAQAEEPSNALARVPADREARLPERAERREAIAADHVLDERGQLEWLVAHRGDGRDRHVATTHVTAPELPAWA